MKDGLALAVNIAAALVFFAMSIRLRSRWLMGVGLAFAAACAVMANGLLQHATACVAVGYALGFAASVAGFLALAIKFPPRPDR